MIYVQQRSIIGPGHVSNGRVTSLVEAWLDIQALGIVACSLSTDCGGGLLWQELLARVDQLMRSGCARLPCRAVGVGWVGGWGARQKHRQTDRHTHTHTYTHLARPIWRETEPEEMARDRETETKLGRQRYRDTETEIERHTDRKRDGGGTETGGQRLQEQCKSTRGSAHAFPTI